MPSGSLGQVLQIFATKRSDLRYKTLQVSVWRQSKNHRNVQEPQQFLVKYVQVPGSAGRIWETVAIVQMSCFYQAISSLWCENRTNFQKSDLPSLPSSSSQRPPRPLVSARWFKMMVHSQARRVTFPEGRNPIPALLEGLGQKVRCD